MLSGVLAFIKSRCKGGYSHGRGRQDGEKNKRQGQRYGIREVVSEGKAESGGHEYEDVSRIGREARHAFGEAGAGLGMGRQQRSLYQTKLSRKQRRPQRLFRQE